MSKFLKRGLAVVLSMAMIAGLIPVISEPIAVCAAQATKNVNLNVDGTIAGINDPSVPASATSAWSGTYVYFGSNKYRVLDAATTDFSVDGTTKTMFLDCDSVLEMRRFDDDSTNWQTSELRDYLNNDFLTNRFTTGEKAAIAISTEGSGNHASWTDNVIGSAYQPLSGEKIFLLDVREAEHAAYGYSDGSATTENNKIKALSNTASTWWLRTYFDSSIGIGNDSSGAFVGVDPTYTFGVSPALNVNLSSVLFTSAAGSGKASSLLATTASSTKEWNLTLAGGTGLVATRKSAETGSVGLGNTMTVDVSSLGTAESGVDYTQLSAMLVGSDGTVAAYGKVADIVSGVITGSNVTGSEVTVTIPSDVAVGNYSLKVFAEDVNSSASSNATDYASNMADISVTLASTCTEVPTVGKTDESSYQACDGTITGVSDTMEYKVSTEESYTSVPDGITEITGLAPGTYQIRYQATDTVLAGTDAEVTIAAKNPELLSITQPTAITGIANGTPLAGETDSIQAALPSTVAITTQDAAITTATVTWDMAGITGYDPSKLPEQTFTVNGTVALPNGVDNTSGKTLSTSITVTVVAGKEPDWSKAVTYDADQMTYTVLSADGLRWISGVTNKTVTADTYQNDPTFPTATNFSGYTVRLAKDIDLSGKDWTPIGGAYISAGVGGFAGIFDGAGHKITNMKVSISLLTGNNDVDAGFFTDIYGTVKNLSVSGGITIVGGSDRYFFVGGIAGYANGAKINNCASNVDIVLTATGGTCYVGGLIGTTGIPIANCISSGTRTVSGGINSISGGLIGGYDSNGTEGLTNCYYTGTDNPISEGNTTTWISCGTYDAGGSLTALTGNTLSYGSDLKTALNTWVARQGTDSVQYVTWSADDIPSLTTVYGTAHTHNMGEWTKQADGSYTRSCTECGLIEAAETCVTLGDAEAPYATLEEAITAAKEENGSIVKLLSNVSTEQTVEVEKGTFTIDINGKTWTSTAVNGLLLTGTSHITLKDSKGAGSLTNVSGAGGNAICIQSGSATIEGGSYRCMGPGYALKMEDGNAILTGGEFSMIQTTDTVGGLLGSGYAFQSMGDNTWISNVSGNSLSYVKVNSAPVHITTQLEDTALTYSYSAAPEFSVTAQKADGITSDITYQWYKDSTILTGATNASYTAETGLEVGTYHYYCAVTCDGYTLNSSTVVFTVNKQAGSIANKEAGVGYAADYIYTGSSIAAPLATEFTTNSDGTVNFTWYAGDTTTEENRLGSEPVAVGSYILKAEVPEMNHYTAASTTVKVTIGYLKTDVVAVLSGTLGENNWYTSNVTVSAPDGYAIAVSNGSDASWSSSLTVDTDRTGAYTYYLKQIATGYITDAKAVTINRDTKVPVLRYVITAVDNTLTDTTAEISFRSGETGSYYYSVEKSGSVPSVNDLFAGKAHDMVSGSNKISMAGLERNTEYTLYIAGKDQAGNPTGVVTAVSFQTAKTSLAGAEVTLTKNSETLDANSCIYNGTSQIPDVTVRVGGTTLDADQYSISYSNSNGGNGNTTDAGTVTVTVTAKDDTNETTYDYTGSATTSYMIAKKSVEVTIANVTKQYGQVNPTLTLQPLVAGQLIGDDTIADLHITLSTTAGTASEAGNYPITGTGSNANYEVKVYAGTLTITKIDAALSVPATTVTKTYGDKAFSLGATTAGTAALSYQSSSTAVATVNSAGTVTIKGCGVTTITVTAAGTSYNSVAKTITLTVNPKTMGTPSLKSPSSKKLTVTWKKDSKVSGYQIAYSTSSKFTAKTTKTVTVKSYKTLTKAISKLKSGKNYYVQIRSYKSSGSTTVYSGWSKTAKIKVK